MLLHARSPGPPWLPIPPFADSATLTVSDPPTGEWVAALALVDRRFRIVSTTPWTIAGRFGLVLGAGTTVVPSGAQWWVVSVGFHEDPTEPVERPHHVFRVRWGLHL